MAVHPILFQVSSMKPHTHHMAIPFPCTAAPGTWDTRYYLGNPCLSLHIISKPANSCPFFWNNWRPSISTWLLWAGSERRVGSTGTPARKDRASRNKCRARKWPPGWPAAACRTRRNSAGPGFRPLLWRTARPDGQGSSGHSALSSTRSGTI